METRNFDWQPFTEDFDYEKEFYDVRLKDGTIIRHCWPNAGFMNSCSKTPDKWSMQDGVEVRLSPDSPLFDEAEDVNDGTKVLVMKSNPDLDAGLVTALREHLAKKEHGMLVVDDEGVYGQHPKSSLEGMANKVAMAGIVGMAAMAGNSWGLPGRYMRPSPPEVLGAGLTNAQVQELRDKRAAKISRRKARGQKNIN